MALMLLCLSILFPQDTIYSGTAKVVGLGDVSFPEGEWILEHRTKPTDKHGVLDAYVFKRKGDRLERLSITRKAPENALSIDCYFDSLGDSMSNGIPVQITEAKSKHDTAHIFAAPRGVALSNGNVLCKTASYVYTSEDHQPPWMGNAFVCSVDGWVLVVCHASPNAISPADALNIYLDSKFRPGGDNRE